MSTEQKPTTEHKPATEPKYEPNALASGITGSWTKFKQGQLLSYRKMAILLLLVAAIGGGWWLVYERGKAESSKWVALDGKSSVDDLKQFTEEKDNQNSIQAKLANLEIARIHLGPEGMERMFVKASDFSQVPNDLEAEKKARETRAKAVANVEKAREEFAKLVEDFKDDPVIKVECMLACAKAEAVLLGIPKEGQLTERRGSPAKAIEWLDKVAEAAPDTDWGKDAKKLADAVRNQNTQQQVEKLQTELFSLAPELPPVKSPTGP